PRDTGWSRVIRNDYLLLHHRRRRRPLGASPASGRRRTLAPFSVASMKSSPPPASPSPLSPPPASRGRERPLSVEEQVRLHAELLNAVGQAVIATDLEGRVIFWNSAAE